MTPKPQTRCDKYFIRWDIAWENSAMKSIGAISGYLLFISQNEKPWKNYEMSMTIHINSPKEILYFCIPSCYRY